MISLAAVGAKTARTQSTYALSVKEVASAGTVAGPIFLQAGTRAMMKNN